MLSRITVALIGLPVVFYLIWLGGFWAVGLVALVLLIGGFEFYRLMNIAGHHPAIWLGMTWIVLILLHFSQPLLPPGPTQQLFALSAVLTVGIIGTTLYALYQPHAPLAVWVSTLAGAIYLGILGGQAIPLRLLEHGVWWLIFALMITWANDTVAYLIGSRFGRHHPWPKLSPKKSWEGTIAGWIGAALMGGLFIYFTPLPHTIWLGLLLGALSGVLSLYGDLAESMLKRQIGVKDSGTILPGHGGMLDRLDSVLFVVPFIYQAARLLEWIS